MITTKLYLDVRYKKADGTCAVKISVNNKGNFLLATGVDVEPDNWSGHNVSKSDRSHKAKNAKLAMLMDKVNLAVLDIERRTPNISNKLLKEYINRALSGGDGTARLLTDVIDMHIENKSAKQTILSYLQTKDKVLDFDKYVDIGNINVSWINKFNKHLLDSGLSINSAGIHLRNLRAVMNFALDNEYTDNYPFRRFSIKKQETPKRSLSVEQLCLFMSYPVEEHLVQYRDMFMLSFYLCGINIVDLVNCKKITEGRIEYYRSKTAKLYSIKVEPEAMAIIDKYRGKEYLLDVLERCPNYRTYDGRLNRMLKLIGPVEVVNKKGLKKHTPLFPDLSFYWARHTWATLASEAGVSDDVISQALGHSTANPTSAIYIKRNLKKIDKANRKLLDFIKERSDTSEK